MILVLCREKYEVKFCTILSIRVTIRNGWYMQRISCREGNKGAIYRDVGKVKEFNKRW